MVTADPTVRDVVEAMWRRDAMAQREGVSLAAIALGAVSVEMTIDDRHLGDHGVVHGGVLFALADIAMSYAANSHNLFAVATSGSIDFVDAAHPGETLRAAAVEHSLRGKVGIYDVAVRAQSDDRLVATFRGNTLRVGGTTIDR